MSEPEITVRKLSYPVEIQLLGVDEQGRQLYRCPTRGCGETGYIDEEGLGHCPVGDAEKAFLQRAYESLREHVPESPGLGFDPTIFKHAAAEAEERR